MADGPGNPAGGTHETGGERSSSNVRDQDRFVPISNISRIMMKVLLANGKIAKDTKDTVQECVTEFIGSVTSEASDRCLKEKRETINGDDLLWAMATLGFGHYTLPLKACLSRYREVQGETNGSSKGGYGSDKRDTVESQLAPNAEFTHHEGSYTEDTDHSHMKRGTLRYAVRKWHRSRFCNIEIEFPETQLQSSEAIQIAYPLRTRRDRIAIGVERPESRFDGCLSESCNLDTDFLNLDG